MTDVVTAMHARRSVSPRRLGGRGPDAAGLARIVDAAGAAPDHGLLRPWRFVNIPADRRTALADLFLAAALELDPDLSAADREEARAKALRGPAAVAVIARIDAAHPKIPAHEQWISVGAALQNAHLAAEAEGFRAICVSGPRMGANALRAAFCGPSEHLVGFLLIGEPQAAIPTPARPTADAILTEWSA